MLKPKFKHLLFYLTALAIISPLTALGLQSIAHDSESFTFLLTVVVNDVVLNTLLIVCLTAIGVLTIGVSCAWLTVRYSYLGKSVLQWLLLIPLAFPSYILAYVYTDAFDQANTLAISLRASNLEWLLPNIRNVWGASFILTFCLYPYVYLFARNGFLAGSQNQMDNARLLGVGKISQFFQIALPATRPFIITGLMLVVMETLADYGTMDYFGIKVFSTVIYDSWAGYGDITAAARLSLLLLTFVLMMVWIEKHQRQKMRFYSLENIRSNGSSSAKGNLLMSAWCALPVAIGFIIPAILLLNMVFDSSDLKHIYAQISRTLPYLANTLIAGFLVAVIGVALAFILTSQKRETQNKSIRVLFNLCGFGYAIPGIILGLGLLLVSSLFSQLNLLVTGSFIFLIVGYLTRFLNISLQGLEAGYEKISPSIFQMSKLIRHNRFYDFWQVKLPLLLPTILSTALILSVEVIKELPLTLVLRPFDFDTLAVYTYNLASDERLNEAAFPALCIVLAGLVPILLLQKLFRRLY